MKKLVSILAAAMFATMSVGSLACAENADTTAVTAPEAIVAPITTEQTTSEQAAPAEETAATEQTAAPADEVTLEDGAVQSASSARTMYVTAYNGRKVNLRSSRSLKTNRNILVQLRVGQAVTVLSETADWARVSVNVNGRTRTGYIWKAYLADSELAHMNGFRTVASFRVTVNPTAGSRGFVNFRSAASTAAARIRRLYMGEQLTVTAENSDWYQVTDAYGRTGYVAKPFVKA